MGDGAHDRPMTLQEHLAELRGRLIKALAGVGVGMVGGFFVADRVQDYFIRLVERVAPQAELIATTPTEKFGVFCTIALYVGIGLAMPLILYQLVRFLAPGLTRAEKRYVYILLPAILLCFVLGILFAMVIALPGMLHFLFGFGDARIKTAPRASEVLGFCSNLALWTGIAFELPVGMFLLASLNILPYRVLRHSRKYAAIGLMILAGIITPSPEPQGMLLIWAAMYLLFEVGLILARFARPRRQDSTLALLAGTVYAATAPRARSQRAVAVW